MRKVLLSLTAVSAFAVAAAATPAGAMTVGTASVIQDALAGESLVQDAAYVCRHRFYTSRRVCYWTPRHRRPWRRYRRW
jgi:hypothetical protein